MNTLTEQFDRQDRFEAAIMAAFKNGTLPNALTPYFRWKEGGNRPTRKETTEMRCAASDFVEQHWSAAGADDETLSYMDYVENELLNIHLMYLNGIIR